MNILLKSMLHKSFEFHTTSYEIHGYGRCLQHETCDTHIIAEYSISAGMMFRLRNNPTYIDDKFSFSTSSDDLLEDRILYGRLFSTDYTSRSSSQPILCNIFPQNGVIGFATPNPIRVVEFSGTFKLI